MNASADEREGFAAFLLRMRTRGVDSRALFAAMEAEPRSGFMPVQWQPWAWSDRLVPIECGETIEGCDFQAAMIAMLDVKPDHRVLEIGTGSGFTTSVLGRLAKRVLSLERYRTLADQARQRIEAMGLENVVIRHADGHSGAPGDGPFDRIIAWAAFESMPRSFVDQLAANGVMIAPLGPGDDLQTMARLEKTGSRFERTDMEQVRLQPLVKGAAEAI